MLLKVIFILKENNENINFSKIKQDYKNIVEIKEDMLILQEYKYEYFLKKTNKMIQLEISPIDIKYKRDKAKSLSILKQKLTNGSHRKGYYIIIDFDGSSMYYCEQLNKYVSKFERKLREFIYICFIKVYGDRWIEKIDDEISCKVKERSQNGNKNALIETALDHFEFQDYMNFLFEKKIFCTDIDVTVKEIKEKIKTDKYSEKKEILKELGQFEKKNLWSILCSKYSDFLEEDIKKIRDIRNTVVHNKNIEYDNFLENRKILKKSIQKLDDGIKEFWNDNLNEFNGYEIKAFITSIENTIKNIGIRSKELNKNMEPLIGELKRMNKYIIDEVVKPYAEMGGKIKEIIEPISKINLPQIPVYEIKPIRNKILEDDFDDNGNDDSKLNN